MKFKVVVFPGSNCDHDCYYVLKNVMKQDVGFLWHKEDSVGDCECLVLPGGFSYGDYLRVGAIAKFSPIMRDIVRFARDGGLVLGICNGFQILTESGLLPGALMRNASLHFICKDVFLRIENNETPFTGQYKSGETVRIPIAHMDGNYYASEEELSELNKNNQVVLRYSGKNGMVDAGCNPNGSLDNIAGVCNRERNVLGMMPHPERCAEDIMANNDGYYLFKSVVLWLEKNKGL